MPKSTRRKVAKNSPPILIVANGARERTRNPEKFFQAIARHQKRDTRRVANLRDVVKMILGGDGGTKWNFRPIEGV